MIGIDILDVRRLKAKDQNFIKRVFSTDEITYAEKKGNYFQTLAGIYAAKEAAIKAYSFSLSYIIKNRIEMRHSKNKPALYLDGLFLSEDISISHDGNFAIAVCNRQNHNLISDNKFKQMMPKRDSDSHKGDYGRIAILGGSEGMSGSVYLSSLAALRSGAGLVYIICPKSISTVLQIKCNEQIILPVNSPNFIFNKLDLANIYKYLEGKDVLAIGPGMGRDNSLNLFISGILNRFSGKIIIDADGLNAISLNKEILHNNKNIVLTPHLKEFERLIGLPISTINEDRCYYAKKFAKKYKVILVLKSEKTIVTDGDRVYINEIGNPGMATAGSGDVLTGVISSFLKRLDSYDASCLGVYIHSLAGDIASYKLSEDSLIASDIVNNLYEATKLLR
ncbi:NAD(P)H-hydrate dehydratase [uncultured Anaerococcus sp.]|uniref:NAD(P)H-hydrate dehydratase n=1 Tax=uncultured Anaerococcus sp. TaxID=293428 RepID=UPI00280A6390|nr:NAD(P)H-hydrate dehydratase [uncultured Anaerococcus sp.]MDU5149431.1 NAD(P)H-hydrate dehydratase [Anaerococcus prevotii]